MCRQALMVLGVVAAVALAEDPSKAESPESRELLILQEAIRRLRAYADELEERARLEGDPEPMQVTLAELGLKEAIALPAVVRRPVPPSMEFAWPRGVAWLASWQCDDGSWPCESSASELATVAIAGTRFDVREGCIAQLKIFLAQVGAPPAWVPGDRSERRAPRERAHALLAGLALQALHPTDRSRRAVEHTRDLLLDGGSDGRPSDPLATAWAVVALQMHARRDGAAPAPEWSAPELPARSVPEVIAALLRRRAAGPRLDHEVDADLAARLADTAEAVGDRSLEEWFLGSLALKPAHPEGWKVWRAAMVKRILRAQDADGSWCEGEVDDLTSRVRATALALLCLRTAAIPPS